MRELEYETQMEAQREHITEEVEQRRRFTGRMPCLKRG